MTKEIQMTKLGNRKLHDLPFWISDFEFVSDFGFRIQSFASFVTCFAFISEPGTELSLLPTRRETHRSANCPFAKGAAASQLNRFPRARTRHRFPQLSNDQSNRLRPTEN